MAPNQQNPPALNPAESRVNANLERFLNSQNVNRRELQMRTGRNNNNNANRRTLLRLGTVRGGTHTFAYGQDLLLDRAINELLDPELRPVPPQPNCPQSMRIYQDHRVLASDFLDTEKEISDLMQYRAELEDRLAKADAELGDSRPLQSTAEEVDEVLRLQNEKDALLQFQSKLSTQLQLINRAKNKQLHTQQSAPQGMMMAGVSGGQARSAQQPILPQGLETLSLPPNLSGTGGALPSSLRTPPSRNMEDGWVYVQQQQQQQQQQQLLQHQERK